MRYRAHFPGPSHTGSVLCFRASHKICVEADVLRIRLSTAREAKFRSMTVRCIGCDHLARDCWLHSPTVESAK